MTDIAFVLLGLFLLFWIYTIVMIFTGKFKEEKVKVFWMIGILAVPLLAFFYHFLKKDLIVK